MKFKKIKKSLFPDLPHLKLIAKKKIEFAHLGKRITGKIRLLNKYIDIALRKGTIQEEEDSFYAFSKRIAREIKHKIQSNGVG